MLALALVASVALAQLDEPRFGRFASRTEQGRSDRGFDADAYAFFEAFPASGAGVPAACSTTAPTGAKGETLTFTRGSVATCTATAAGGLVSSGIANGDLVELSSNVARVEYDSAGVKGLRVQGSGQNVLTRFIDYTNAAWSDVGTPTPTASQASPFSGTYANSAVLYDDNDGAGFEGRSIPVAVTATSAYIAFCYVKAGTATSARIVLDGTAATITGLSSSTWSIIEVADASASAASVTFEVDVGSTAATTGSVVFGGCDVKLGTYRTSIVPTVAAAVTRSSDLAYFALTGAPGFAVGSMAASINPNSAMSYATPVATATSTVPPGSGADQLVLYAGGTSGASYKCYMGNTAASLAVTGAAAFVAPANGPHRGYCAAGGIGGTLTGGFDTNSMSASAAIPAGPYGAENYLFVGSTNNAITYVDSIVSRICRDPIATRCR